MQSLGFINKGVVLTRAFVLSPRASIVRNYNGLFVDNTNTFREVGPNLPRIAGVSGGLLIELGNTNSIRNPAAEGATSGTMLAGVTGTIGGLLWNRVNAGSGLAMDFSTIAVAGRLGLRLRFYGTTSASPTQETIEFDARGAIAAAAGQIWSTVYFLRLAVGAWPTGLVQNTRIISRDGLAAVVNNVAQAQANPTANWGTYPQTLTLGAAVADVIGGLHLTSWPVSTALDFSIDVFAPLLVNTAGGLVPLTPILPAPGVQAASTRPSEVLVGSLSALGISGADDFTTILPFIPAQPLTASGTQTLIQVDDNTVSNRMLARCDAGSASLNVYVVSGGAGSGPVSVGTLTAGVRACLAITRRAGIVRASLNGGAVSGQSGGPTSGFITQRVGAEDGIGTACMNLQIAGTMRTIRRFMSDTELQSLSSTN